LEQSQAIVAPTTSGDTWRWSAFESLALTADLTPADRRRLADLWLEDAQSEHASVASFSRAAMELMAVGAPPDLVADTHQAALDEIRHAQMCFSLASAYAGESLTAGPLALVQPRNGDLVTVAVNTFVEGCVGESIAALVVFRGAQTCGFDDVRKALQSIADDEANHAALAWRTVNWAVATGGRPVLDALIETADALRPGDDTEPANAVDMTVVHDHGRIDLSEQAAAARDAWRGIIDPALAQLNAQLV
jgi:hypothetical protein